MTEFSYKDFIIEYDINQEGELESFKVFDDDPGNEITQYLIGKDIEDIETLIFNHYKGIPLHTNLLKNQK